MKQITPLLLFVFISVFGYSTSVNAQNFTDTLNTVYLNKSPNSFLQKSNYHLLNEALIDMESINFSKEIRVSKKQKTVINLENGETILKSRYLKTLRSSANSTDDINAFYTRVYLKIPSLKNEALDDSTLSKLYIAVKNNSLRGKLDHAGKELSWL